MASKTVTKSIVYSVRCLGSVPWLRSRQFNSWGGGGGGGRVADFEKKFPASACRKKKIACSTNVIESLWEKKGKKYPAHHIARKKNSWWPEITHPHPQELNGRPLRIRHLCFIKIKWHYIMSADCSIKHICDLGFLRLFSDLSQTDFRTVLWISVVFYFPTPS